MTGPVLALQGRVTSSCFCCFFPLFFIYSSQKPFRITHRNTSQKLISINQLNIPPPSFFPPLFTETNSVNIHTCCIDHNGNKPLLCFFLRTFLYNKSLSLWFHSVSAQHLRVLYKA